MWLAAGCGTFPRALWRMEEPNLSSILGEELIALSSIYCDKDELEIRVDGSPFKGLGTTIAVNDWNSTAKLCPETTKGHIVLELILNVLKPAVTIATLVTLTKGYPRVSPTVSFQLLGNPLMEQTKKEFLKKLEASCTENVLNNSTAVGEPCLYQLLEHVKQFLIGHLDKDDTHTAAGIDKDTLVSYLINIDHIRNETLYYKCLQSLCKQTNVSCKVINISDHHREIFVELTGMERDVKSFLKQWKTQNVDIDSRGKPCKEKLISVVGCFQHSIANWPPANAADRFTICNSIGCLTLLCFAVCLRFQSSSVKGKM